MHRFDCRLTLHKAFRRGRLSNLRSSTSPTIQQLSHLFLFPPPDSSSSPFPFPFLFPLLYFTFPYLPPFPPFPAFLALLW